MKKIIAVIGDAFLEKNSDEYIIAYETGRILIDNGYRVQCGGLGGVMESVCEVAKSSSKYLDGDTIGIVPSFDRNKVNQFVDIVIPTGLDIMRNGITGNADAVIAIGGGAGTLSEMAISWSLYRLIIAYKNIPGWAKELANKKIDSRIRYPEIEDDRIYGINTPEEAIQLLKEKIDLYNKSFEGLSSINPKSSR